MKNWLLVLWNILLYLADKKPILNVDVILENGHSERIVIYDKDSIDEVA